ncbi:MAG: polyprenyl synthetase family protein, partial [Chloroflexi bacterium]|nr:polyprenyl synthetase family protein [Chloroflexota bacterium]
MNKGTLTQNAIGIVTRAGQFAQLQACQKILENKYDNGTVCEALHYYAKTVLPKVLPIFPALICLSSKAVGANPENARSIATALLLITASGDIHDDIVDNSTRKFERKTVVGKYGKNIALLAGDALLIQGTTTLQNECRILPSEQSKEIADSIAA